MTLEALRRCEDALTPPQIAIPRSFIGNRHQILDGPVFHERTCFQVHKRISRLRLFLKDLFQLDTCFVVKLFHRFFANVQNESTERVSSPQALRLIEPGEISSPQIRIPTLLQRSQAEGIVNLLLLRWGVFKQLHGLCCRRRVVCRHEQPAQFKIEPCFGVGIRLTQVANDGVFHGFCRTAEANHGEPVSPDEPQLLFCRKGTDLQSR